VHTVGGCLNSIDGINLSRVVDKADELDGTIKNG
jgi:hypothetical protein